ncbi:tRNA (adenosine(37)-N6)-threonylcarbamoyltransferase complex ATPase subunit type 1 TsaE [Croceivirga sp. JEA036]|uniref:tRNA (adenosine(37)-N6)-threonylcarbamoyltransferase complex ATPase subunit type 1 TsaE n=1 Tax=Croceivirga sp. JEA036 TaxID=2721162 RepID=UPI0014393AA8|nr:tRNA (adenosine(37)-N6)-threonylcarbamoyltransferase complex ATPase subunit type 1 TsaE [Croceivirga sp. JEA036]NJB35567.1 tRNA (adenosine(37)-N6)-threonylcarbamoyltransferase complex ATPase subunit type 1 TsaE [Croceivirga sp. JEA036]
MKQIRFNKTEVKNIAQQLLTHIPERIICFHGEMGTGKTTTIKEMVQLLGAIDAGNSPTFGIVNEYHNKQGELVAYHFDFYRLNHEEEALDLGLEEYLDSGVHVFIEWPEKIENLLPEIKRDVYLQFVEESVRTVEY